jgi:hypothetical protein
MTDDELDRATEEIHHLFDHVRAKLGLAAWGPAGDARAVSDGGPDER